MQIVKNLRVGFIGCGRHATKILFPSLHLARLDLLAVCDIDEAAARRNARWFGAESVYTDHRSMLEKESLEAVIICTGAKTHTPIAIDCIERGLPVFVEKPPALNLAEAERLRKRSEALDVPVMVGTMKRHSLIYRRMKEIISSPDFGPIAAVEAKMGLGWKNKSGYALLLDAGIHIIDLLRFLMGEVAGVSYQKYQFDETHTSYAIALKFESGAVGNLTVSDQQLWMRNNERVEVTGNGQFILAENMIHLSHYLPDGEINVWEPGFSIPNDENSNFFIGGYARELRAFAEAIREGTPMQAGIADACAALEIIKQIEPEEQYIHGPSEGAPEYPHWQSENYWLQE
ncbi:MAG: Gfo/Idh/MocA family oxidoreductase [Anaerolineales bacterium]|nr:Gfo/Idh/MocA family oxidoreductase [Anaerolineales bacterium]